MTAPNASPSMQQLALGDFDHEMARTRRVLERVPDDRFDWTPHAKSMPIGKLATHVAQVPGLLLSVLSADEFDPTAGGGNAMAPAKAATRDDVLRLFDDLTAKLRDAMARTTDEAWLRTWTFRRGEHVIMRQPKAAAIRTLGISHLAHHRGQLSVYLRLLDIPVPSIYGPSADEPM